MLDDEDVLDLLDMADELDETDVCDVPELNVDDALDVAASEAVVLCPVEWGPVTEPPPAPPVPPPCLHTSEPQGLRSQRSDVDPTFATHTLRGRLVRTPRGVSG